jgi:hypothetical protein
MGIITTYLPLQALKIDSPAADLMNTRKLLRQTATRCCTRRQMSLRLWTYREERKMGQPTVIRAMEGGLLGTLLQAMMVYGVMPLMLGQVVDQAAVQQPCAVGLLAHVFSGGVLFPLAYVCLPSQDLQRSPVLKGVLWAGLLWGITEIIIAPMLGAGLFSAAFGGFPAAGRALLGYLVYGATLGGMVGAAEH